MSNLQLPPKSIKSTRILNPIELGKSFDDKTFVLDVKVLLNDASVINLDFSPFPGYPDFYAMNKMMNVKKHYIYNDNFTLNVLDLTQTELATDEDMRKRIAVFIEKSMTETIILISDGKEFSHE